MAIFKKKENSPINIDKITSITFTTKDVKEAPKTLPAEWIWVEGYKGTDKNMKCMNNFQFTLGETYTLEEPIEMCANGFHFSPTLEQTFRYYSAFGRGNRFFKVKALINKNQMITETYRPYYASLYDSSLETRTRQMKLTDDKLVAKSIIFLEEVSIDEIIKAQKGEDSLLLQKSDKFKEDLRIGDLSYAQRKEYQDIINNLDCYSDAFKEYTQTLYDDKVVRKIALLGQEKINHETRMQMIFDNKYNI